MGLRGLVMFAAALGAGLRATAGGQQEPTDVPKEVWQGYHRHFAHEYFKSWGHWSADGGSDSPELIWYSRYHGTPAKTKQNPVGNPHPVIPYNVNPGHKFRSGRNFTPSVIEPSFGIGRIMYCMFEHSFYVRKDDEQKTVFRFSPVIAPIKCTIFPLLNDAGMNELSNVISRELSANGVSTKLDTTAVSVGKRYARTDELGVPFAVTVDHRSLEDDTVTVRERDSCEQVRVKTAEVLPLVTKLCAMRATWEQATAGMEKQTAAAE